MPMGRSVSVAVIGAGVSGLFAARELKSEGHRVVVFEKGDRIGGTWVYDPRVETDPLSLDPTREIVHGSLYRALRTNLPRQLMEFLDYPFSKRQNGDPRTFPGHEEVLWFLTKFAHDFGLVELTRFNAEVVRAERVGERNDEWLVEWKTQGSDSVSREVFEAVVVCSGNFVEPEIPVIAGIEKWPGFQIHSHNYRVSEQFRDQIVVLIGFGASAFDISRNIASEAKEVHIATRSPDVKVGKLENHNNIWQHMMIDHVCENGTVVFQDGSSVCADTIFYCTGQMQDHGLPKRSTHFLTPFQIGCPNWLCAQIGLPPLEKWRYEIYEESIKNIKEMRDGYKDQWDDAYWEGIIKESQEHGREADASK